MKYILVIICIFSLWISSNSYIDLSHYERDTKVVEIKGEVINPGVYEVDYNATIADVLELAGGVKEAADLRSVNLSRDISNESVIVIPEFIDSCISLNMATLEELTTLVGIGPSTAQSIINYREEFGFRSIEELMLVKGIKEKSYDKVKDRICL